MPSALFRTMLEVVLKDKASAAVVGLDKSVTKVGESAVKTGENFKQLAGAFTSLVVATKIKQALVAVIEPARKMEQALMRLQFTSGKTGAELMKMRDAAFATAEKTIFGPQAAMDATVSLNRALRDTESTTKALDVAAGLAQASFGKMTMEKSGEMVANMAKAFGMGADEIRVAGDKVQAVSLATGMGAEDLSEVMGKLGQAGLLAGQNFDQMLSTFGIMRRVMQSPKQAATLMTSMFAKMGSSKTVDAFRKVGLAIEDVHGNLRPMADIMGDVSVLADRSMGEFRTAMREAFGVRTIKPMLSLVAGMQKGIRTADNELIRGADLWSHLNDTMDGAAGSIDRGINLGMATADQQMRRAGEAMGILKTAVGNLLLPVLGPLATVLMAITTTLAKIIELPIIGYIFKFVAVSMALGASFMMAKLMLGGFKDLLGFAAARLGMMRAAVVKKTAAMNADTAATGAATIANKGLSFQFRNLAGNLRVLPGLTSKVVFSLKWLGRTFKSILGATGFGLILVFLPKILEWAGWIGDKIKDWGKEVMKTAAGLKKNATLFERFGAMFVPANVAKKYKLEIVAAQKKQAWQKAADRLRRSLDEAAAQKIKGLLLAGTKPFHDATKKLSGMLGFEPKVVDPNAVAQVQKLLSKIVATGAGGTFTLPGAAGGKVLGTEDVSDAASAGIKITEQMALWRKVIAEDRASREKGGPGVALRGRAAQEIYASMTASIMSLQNMITGPKGAELVKKLTEKTAGAFGAGLSPEALAHYSEMARRRGPMAPRPTPYGQPTGDIRTLPKSLGGLAPGEGMFSIEAYDRGRQTSATPKISEKEKQEAALMKNSGHLQKLSTEVRRSKEAYERATKAIEAHGTKLLERELMLEHFRSPL
jgi:TP901 family phage tail tape measure protein